MVTPPSPSKMSPRTQYFLVVFAVTFLVLFVFGRLAIGHSRFHPGVPLQSLPVGKSILASLAFALMVGFFTAKKKFG
jgi:hypothetical protein